MRNARQRVSYLPSPDMQFAFFKERIEHLLTTYKDDDTQLPVVDLLELYEISRYFDCDQAKQWIAENNFDSKAFTDSVKRRLINAINALPDGGVLALYESLEHYFKDAFLNCVSTFSLFKAFTKDTLLAILDKQPRTLRRVLNNKRIVDKYDGAVRTFMISSKVSAEFILDKFVNKRSDKDSPINLPSSLTTDDINAILSLYLDSDEANWNYVNMIAHSKDSGVYHPSLAVKAKADRYIQENDPFKNGKTSGIGVIEHSIHLQYDGKRHVISEKTDNSDTTTEYYVDCLSGCDAPTFIHSLVSTLQLTNKEGVLELCFKNGFDSEYEALVTRGRDYYPVSPRFDRVNKQALARLLVFSAAIEHLNDKTLEQYLSAFYSDYLKEEYSYVGRPLTFARKDDSTLVKVRSTIPIIEGILKDYALYASNQAGDNAFAKRYRLTSYKNVPSPIRKKYVTVKDYSDFYVNLCHLLFSDLSLMRYVEPFKTDYQNFYFLILRENVKRTMLDEIQNRAVNTLIDNGILIVDEDDNIRFKSIELVTILYDLYRNGTCIYWQYPPTSHVIINSLVEFGLLTFQNTLLTNEEADYLSYLLKNDVFTNGPAIRNTYAHDQYDGPADSNTLTGHYTHLLLIIIFLLFKIESDLLIEKKLGEAGYDDEIVRNDLS